MTTPTPNLVRLGGVLIAPVVLALTACGSDDPAPESPAPTAAATDSEPTDGASDDASGGQTDDPRFGVDLEQTGEILVKTYADATAFSVDGSRLTVTFSAGSAGTDSAIDCLSAIGLMQEDETLVFEYPDGPANC